MLGLRRVAVVLGVLAVGLVFGCGGAWGALQYPFDGQLAPAGGSFGFLDAGSVAVNDSNGDVYVADGGLGAVNVFSSVGVQVASLDGSLTPAGSFGGGDSGGFSAGQVSVAANNGTSEVYVLDSTHNVADVFDASGSYVCQITGSASPSASECNGAAGSATPAGGFNQPRGIAVDQATGDVYVVDGNDAVVDVFSAGGEYLRQILLASVPGGFSANYARELAVDDFNGHVYVSDSGREAVYEFDGTGGYVATWTGSNTPAGSFEGYLGVAADDATGEVYVSSNYPEKVVDVFEASGGYLRHVSHVFHEPLGVAVDQASGRVYVSDDEPGVVDVFDPAALLPAVATGSASSVAPRGATLEGSVDPEGVQLSDCHFDYGTSTAYGQVAPCVPAATTIPVDSNEHAVTAGLAGLTPGTTYHFRLQASNANCAHCTSFGEDATFATPPPPSIAGESASNVTGASADLAARIDPNGQGTTYRFEYGTSAAYGTSVPVPDGDIGAGTSPVPVTTHLTGLAANTTYHWRVLATNASGTTTGVDHTFVYSTSGGGLPDGRAYEMVTPVQKNGALIGNGLFISHADISEDGSRVILSSIQCLAGAGSCNANRITEGEPYLFSRTAGGWAMTALAPPATQLEVNTNLLMSADAGTALFTSPTAPFGEEDWWARGPEGSFSDIGPAYPPAMGRQGPGPFSNGLPAVTADLSHLVWESPALWPFDATVAERPSLYEYVGSGGSQPVLVGVSGPAGSTSLIGVCGTRTGGLPGALSADGRTVFFSTLSCASGSGANAGVRVPAQELSARVDESRTVLLSGRSPLDCTSAGCLASPAGDARFWGAATDGSRVFFTSTQQLTDSASEDGNGSDSANRCEQTAGANGCNLYEYDFTRPSGHNLVAVSAGDTSGHGPRVQGVMGVSADGSHVYFVAKGVLSAVANSEGQSAQDGANNLYVFERDATHPEGRVAFVAALPGSDSEQWIEGDRANVTPDGRFLVLASHGRLTADDTSTTGVQQVFRYDAQTGMLVRISIGEAGFNDNGNAGVADANIVPAAISTDLAGAPRLDPTMSHDGAYVFFMSPVGLTPRALDDVQIGTDERGAYYAQNVYEWHEGHVYLISDGRDVGTDALASCQLISSHALSSVCLIGSDGSGANVFFTTADRLVPGDTDTQVDYYDAHICTGGDPCIGPVSSAPVCQGEACHGTPPGAPVGVGGGTSTFSGSGNVIPVAPVVHSKLAVKKKHAKHRSRKRPRRRHAKAKGRRASHGTRGSGGGRS